MFPKEEIALFELEIQFEEAAANPALTAGQRQQQMQAVLERMHANVMVGYRISPALGQHLSDLALDYLAREDLAMAVVKDAFTRNNSGKIVGIHQQLMVNELRRTVARIKHYNPEPVAAYN